MQFRRNRSLPSSLKVKSWKDKKSRKNFFERLAVKLGLKEMDDWYKVTQTDMSRHGGSSLITYYYGSVSKALNDIYPEHNWIPWKFPSVNDGIWQDVTKHKEFFDWLGVKLGYKCIDDWYNITSREIHQNGGDGLMQGFAGSPYLVLSKVYPQHEWLPWRFAGGVPKHYWQDMSKRVQFFEWLGRQLGYKEMEDWYDLSHQHVFQFAPGLLVNYYKNSPFKALQDVYPQYNWKFWRMKYGPKGYWKQFKQNKTQQKEMIEYLADVLSIKQMSDWYRVSSKQTRQYFDMLKLPQLGKMLSQVYTNHQWDLDIFGKYKKTSQRQLVIAVQNLFPTQSTRVCISLCVYRGV